MIYHRWAPSLGELEDTAENIWGTVAYNPEKHIDEPCIFFGLYGLPDFYTLWKHKGKKWILWAGSDIRHFKNGYWLDEGGAIKLIPLNLAQWINKYCESWVENETERYELEVLGMKANVCPSFLGDIDKYEVSYKWNERPKVYSSISGNDFDLYGWGKIPKLAWENSSIEFNLYGNTKQPYDYDYDKYWEDHGIKYPLRNIIIHGRVPKEQMNEEIKQMQGALRLLPMEGFSEIVAKSVLWGQWPISAIKYPYTLSIEELETLKDKKEPNITGREHYRNNLNKFPWNQK